MFGLGHFLKHKGSACHLGCVLGVMQGSVRERCKAGGWCPCWQGGPLGESRPHAQLPRSAQGQGTVGGSVGAGDKQGGAPLNPQNALACAVLHCSPSCDAPTTSKATAGF